MTCFYVGYYNVTAQAGKYALVAINVDQTSGDKFTLDQLFPPNANTSEYGSLGSLSDQVRVWDQDTSSFKYYFRFNNPFGGGDKNHHWVQNIAPSYPLADIELGVGDAVFYKAVKEQTLTIPGEVPNRASKLLKKGYNMMGAGFPAMWNPNDEGVAYWQNSAFSAYGGRGTLADEIRTWDSNAGTAGEYKYYFLFNNPFGGGDKNYHWVDATTLEILDTPLNTGDGFYFIKRKDGDFLFEPPSLRLEK